MIVQGEMIILTSGCQALALFERQLCYEMPSPHATLSGLAWSGLEVESLRSSDQGDDDWAGVWLLFFTPDCRGDEDSSELGCAVQLLLLLASPL